MSLALYRKYRPETFDEVVGQDHITQTLTNAIEQDSISHAYLFTGPRGTGKTTTARLLAKAVNCEEKGVEPCNECESCKEITKGNAVDLIEIDAASHRGIDEIRELREGIKFSPTKSQYKVFIIDESHQLTKAAANALLKTLEEPPEHAIFILATTEPQKMIPTIVSRCQRFDFRRLTIPEIKNRLTSITDQEEIDIEDAALELIALNAGGSIRDAESILDQVLTFSNTDEKIKADDIKDLLGIVDINLVADFVDLLLEEKTAQAIKYVNELLGKGKDSEELTKALVDYLRKGLILKVTDAESRGESTISGLTDEEFEKLKGQISQLEKEELSDILEEFSEAQEKMKYASIPQLPLELAIVDICEE
ncbi:MAG: DNA polymerase III subunit gamma/tau [Candidatus Paceibacterota bacterium]